MKSHTYTYTALFTLVCSSNRGGETFSRVVYECVKSVCACARPLFIATACADGKNKRKMLVSSLSTIK